MRQQPSRLPVASFGEDWAYVAVHFWPAADRTKGSRRTAFRCSFRRGMCTRHFVRVLLKHTLAGARWARGQRPVVRQRAPRPRCTVRSRHSYLICHAEYFQPSASVPSEIRVPGQGFSGGERRSGLVQLDPVTWPCTGRSSDRRSVAGGWRLVKAQADRVVTLP